MPPRERFSKHAIIDAAYQVVRRGGLEQLSARNVAAELGASTAPIYRHFDSMDALADEVLQRSLDLLRRELVQQRHPDPLVSLCLGMWLFQEREPTLYSTYAYRQGDYHQEYRCLGLPLAVAMGDHPRYASLTLEHRIALLERTFLLMNGLVLCFWRGDLPELGHEDKEALIIEMIEPTVEVFAARTDLRPLDPKVRARV